MRKPYSKYKPSGIVWIGDIPDHWNEKRFGYLFSFGKGLNITKEDLLDEGVPCISYGEIHSKYGFEVNPQEHLLRCVSESYLKDFQKCLLEHGDFIFADTSEDLEGAGNFAYYNSNAIAFAGYHTILNKPKKCEHDPRYLAYLFESKPFRAQIQKEVSGTKVFSITKAILKDTVVLLPIKEEQQKIVAYLDEKISKLDTLIAKKTEFIERLKEKRTALISQVVTKGLPPEEAKMHGLPVNPKMKPSGVEWLGEIPEHWNEKRFGYLFSFGKGLNITKEDLLDEGVPCISYGEIHSKYGFEVNPQRHQLKCVSESYLKGSQKSLLVHGDFIFADTSEDLEGAGNFTYYNSNAIAFAGYHTILNKPKNRENDSRYLAYLFDSKPFRAQIQKEVSGTKVFSITKGILKDVVVLLPKNDEQTKIAEFLDKETIKIDSLVHLAESAIQNLLEYRSALITAAVTGKIDVREMSV